MEETSQSKINTAYSGVDNLETMKYAVNYNAYLLRNIFSGCDSADYVCLDFGAGNGFFANEVRKSGKRLVCVEKDDTLRQELRESSFEVKMSLQEVGTEEVDYVYSLNVLEHIEDDSHILAELFRVLKHGKRAFIYVPAMTMLYSSMDRKVGHIRRYSRDELIRKVKSAGFRLEHCTYCDTVGFVSTLVYKFLGNTDGSINRRTVVFFDRVLFPLNRFLDWVFGNWLGKNIIVLARKDAPL